MSQALEYLVFDVSDDADEVHTFDAMASVWPAQWAALEAEWRAVLHWGRRHFGSEGPLDEGALWDVDVQAWIESTPVRPLALDTERAGLASGEALPPDQRCTLTLSLSGGAEFAAALRQQFDLLD